MNEQQPRFFVVMGVSGCGKKATYVYTLGGGWVLNADARPASVPAGPDH